VTATSQADSTASAGALVTVYMQVAISLSGPGTSPFSLPVSTGTASSTAQFTATVTGALNTGVTWSLAENTGSGCGNLGTIDANGLYTAPTLITSYPCQVIVTATSQADFNISAQALVGVHVVITISPSVAQTIGQSANMQFTASVAGTTNQGVNWFAVGIAGGGSGMFDTTPANNGLYVAPELGSATSTQVAINAVSQFDSNQQSPTTTLTVLPSDPIGSVVSYSNVSPCPGSGGVAGGTCYQLNTSCPGVADYSAYIKVNNPTSSAIGTVIFATGTGGSNLYDEDPDFTVGPFNGGLTVVQGVLAANYNTVQISFGSPFNTATPNGWLQGPGGVRRLACRYATVVDWVYNNPSIINPSNTHTTSAPMCATGNSGGSGAIGYAVSDYGLGTELAMIDPTSGPVMTSINQGCSPSGTYTGPGNEPCSGSITDMSYSLADAAIIDSAYQSAGSTTPTLCTNGVVNNDSTNYNRFLSDSILPTATPKTIAIHGTNVNLVFGCMDTTNAVPQGESWRLSVSPKNPVTGSHPPEVPVLDAPHAIPSVADGAAQIVTDITSLCQ
jgi:hypothetical protein